MDLKFYSFLYFIFSLVTLILFVTSWPDGKLHVVQCNVGQGDAVLISMNFHQVLVDSGKNDQVLGCLQKYLPFWDREIDALVATHDDYDHIGGSDLVLKNYQISKIIWNGKQTNSQDWKNIISELEGQCQEKNVDSDVYQIPCAIKVRDISKLSFSGVNLNFLWPNKGQDIIQDMEDNTASAVFRLDYDQFSELFTGDMDMLTEEMLIKGPQMLASTVLKVSHHGSKFASSDIWLEKVLPKLATIGVGKNSYGHPNPETLARLQNHGIKVLRTDQGGDIEIISDGKDWWVEGEEGR